MEMLRRIKIEYGYSDLTWKKQNQLFYSERGLKRICIWKDKQLLQWHIKWRDEISHQSGILINRMIRTKDGERYFISEQGWVTIHDEIEEQFHQNNKETEWGRLIGTILAHGLRTSDDCQRFKKLEPLTLNSVRKTIDQLTMIESRHKLMLERSYFESKQRKQKGRRIIEQINQKKLPILIPFQSLTNGKEIFSQLFWVCGDEQPMKGYEPLRQLLEEWLSVNGEASTIQLLEEIELYFPLRGEQGLLLLNECLLPYELERAINALVVSKSEPTIVIETFINDWELSRQLVMLLSRWIENGIEKAVAK